MRKHDNDEGFFEELDGAIVDAVQKRQFLTAREIWMILKRNYIDVNPGLVQSRINELVEEGRIGYLEQEIGDRVLRRYHCFRDEDKGIYRDNKLSIDGLSS